MQYLLDTNICAFFLRGKLQLDKILKEVGIENCSISEITIFELMYGAENSINPEKAYSALADFINGFTVISISGLEKHYAKEKVRLRKMGKPLHDEFDLLIGVTAVANDLTLITDNVKDFKNIEGIQIENWIKEAKR